MKIVTDTPDLLIVEDRPVLLALGLIGFILAFVAAGLAMVLAGEWWGLLFAIFGGGMGFIAFWAFVRRVQVVFHRPEGYVELRRRNLFGGTRVRHALAEIDRAVIEESQGSDSGTTYRVALVIPAGQSAGRHPVTLAYSSGRAQHRAAEAINAWLQAAR
ncbi:MAG: hypothetical protein KDK28_17865 [Maritimibacter sp.]|nr:hypothetical protein [Maritimibacter sp.]